MTVRAVIAVICFLLSPLPGSETAASPEQDVSVQFVSIDTIIQPITWLHYSVTVDLRQVLGVTAGAQRKVEQALRKATETKDVHGQLNKRSLNASVHSGLVLLKSERASLQMLLDMTASTTSRAKRSLWSMVNSLLSIGGTLFTNAEIRTVAKEVKSNRRYTIDQARALNNLSQALSFWFQKEQKILNTQEEREQLLKPVHEALQLVRDTKAGLLDLMANKVSPRLIPVTYMVQIWRDIQREVSQAKYFLAATDHTAVTIFTVPISHVITQTHAVTVIHVPVMPKADSPKTVYDVAPTLSQDASTVGSFHTGHYIAVNEPQTRHVVLHKAELGRCKKFLGTHLCPHLHRELLEPKGCLPLLYFKHPEAGAACRDKWKSADDSIVNTVHQNIFLVRNEGSILSCEAEQSQVVDPGTVKVNEGCTLQDEQQIVYHLKNLTQKVVIHRNVSLSQPTFSPVLSPEEQAHFRELLKRAHAKVPERIQDPISLSTLVAIAGGSVAVILLTAVGVCCYVARKTGLMTIMSQAVQERVQSVEHRQNQHEAIPLAVRAYGYRTLQRAIEGEPATVEELPESPEEGRRVPPVRELVRESFPMHVMAQPATLQPEPAQLEAQQADQAAAQDEHQMPPQLKEQPQQALDSIDAKEGNMAHDNTPNFETVFNVSPASVLRSRAARLEPSAAEIAANLRRQRRALAGGRPTR